MYRFEKLLAVAVLLLPNCVLGANPGHTIEQMTEASGKIVLGSVLSRTSYWAGNSRLERTAALSCGTTGSLQSPTDLAGCRRDGSERRRQS
jgi:hypothetical protein